MPRKPVKKSRRQSPHRSRRARAARERPRRRTGASRPSTTASTIRAIIDRPRLSWPNGARVAVWVIPNIEHFLFDRPSTRLTNLPVNPDVLNYSWRDYGVRVGIWRMMEVMESYGVKGTVALNSDVCARYPRIIEEGKKLGWEWMGHGNNNSTLFAGQSEAEERALIKEVVGTITKSVGKAPRGWLSPALERDHAHARYPGRERHRICRQLGQRRPALSDAGEEGLDDRHALFGRDQRHSGVARSAPEPGSRSAR